MKVDQVTVSEPSQFMLAEPTIDQQFLFKTIISEMTHTMQTKEQLDSDLSQVLEPEVLSQKASLDLTEGTKQEESRQLGRYLPLTQPVDYSLRDDISRYQDFQNTNSVIKMENRQGNSYDTDAEKLAVESSLQEPASQIQIRNDHVRINNEMNSELENPTTLIASKRDKLSQKALNTNQEDPVGVVHQIPQTRFSLPINELDQVNHESSKQEGSDLEKLHQISAVVSPQLSRTGTTEDVAYFFESMHQEPNAATTEAKWRADDVESTQPTVKIPLTEVSHTNQEDPVGVIHQIPQTRFSLPVNELDQSIASLTEFGQLLSKGPAYLDQNQNELMVEHTVKNSISLQNNIKEQSSQNSLENTLPKEQIALEESLISEGIVNTEDVKAKDQAIINGIQSIVANPLLPTQSSENTMTIPVVTKDGMLTMDQKSESTLIKTLNEGTQKLKYDGDKQQIVIQLFPDSLGKVEVKLSMKQDTIDLQFKMDNLHTKTLFESVTHKFQEILTKADHVDPILNQPTVKMDSQFVVQNPYDVQTQLDSGGAFQQNQERTVYKKRALPSSSEIGQSEFDVKESIKEGNISILV